MGYYGLRKEDGAIRPYIFYGNPIKFLLDIYLGNDIIFIDAENTGDRINFDGLHVLSLMYTLYGDCNLVVLSELESSSVFNYIRKCYRGDGSVDTITIYNNKVISAHSSYRVPNTVCEKYRVFRCPDSKIPKDITYDMLIRIPTYNPRGRVCCVANGYIRQNIHEINDGKFNLILQGSSESHGPCYSMGIFFNKESYYLQDLYIHTFYKNQHGVHVNFSKLKQEPPESFNNEFRIPLNDDDYTKLSGLLSSNSKIVDTDGNTDLSLPSDNFDILNLFDGCITVTTLKQKALERMSKTKTSRDAGILQTYLLSIYMSLVLTNDLIPPEGCYLNLFNFEFECNRWNGNIVKQHTQQPDSFYIVDSATVSKQVTKLANLYRAQQAPSSQVGGSSNPITKYIHTPMIDSGNINSWLACLDATTWYLIGGLARSTKSGISIANKSTNLSYLTSLVYAPGYEQEDHRFNGNRYYYDDSYGSRLCTARKQFYDLNILPNDKRISALNENIKKIRKLADYSVRLREIYTLSDQSLTLLETGFKPFKSITDVCGWWLSMLPLFKSVINPDKYNEHGLKSLNALLDTTALILTKLTEELQED